MFKTLKGFAYLKKYHPERLKKITSEGGTASQQSGKGHRWDKKTATKAILKRWNMEPAGKKKE
jgi:hypothetical protein